MVLPLGWLSFRASWGVLAYLTLVALILCVPRTTTRLVFLFSVLSLVLGFPALRTIADGNLEVLVILGCLLIIYAISRQNVLALIVGILLVTSKIQESWFLILLLPVVLLNRLHRKKLIATLVGLALIGIPCLIWKGPEWFHAMATMAQRGSVMDSSLWATMARFQVLPIFSVALGLVIAVTTIGVFWKSRTQFTRELIGLLVATSLILSPYTAGNNFLTLYAVVAIPLLLWSAPVGLVVIALANLPFVFLGNQDVLYVWSATYWTIALGIIWFLLVVRITFKNEPSQVIRDNSLTY